MLLSTSNDEEGTQVATSDKQEGNADGKGELTTDKEQKMDYSPLGEPDLRDLPSFAHQIAQGMVCAAKFIAIYLCLSLSTILWITVFPIASGVPLLPGCPPP